MSNQQKSITRREFLYKIGIIGASSLLPRHESSESSIDTSLLNPNFLAFNQKRDSLTEVRGIPKSIVTRNGKAAIELYDRSNQQFLYLDPLAINSEQFGQHPAERLLRVRNLYRLPLPKPLEQQLQDRYQRDSLFHSATFEYLPGRQTTAVINEINDDGSIITPMSPIPFEWLPTSEEYLTPSFFSVTPNSFDHNIVTKTGFVFNTSLFGENTAGKVKRILEAKTSRSLSALEWQAAMVRELGISLQINDRMINKSYTVDNQCFFTTMEGYPNSSCGRIYKIDPNGQVSLLYEGPGRLLMAMPNPNDINRILISGEGHQESNPKFQSLFEKNLLNGSEQVIQFNRDSQRPELYTNNGTYDPEGNIILNRYGFPEQGGGLWWINTKDCTDKKQLITWDHAVDWTRLPNKVVITGKEVNDDFSMTINQMAINGTGRSVEISQPQRVGKMQGWNPTIFCTEQTETGIDIVYVTLPYDAKSFTTNTPQAVYRIALN